MNFQELMQRMAELDQPVQEENTADKDHDDEWYDSKGRPDPNGAYDAGGHYHKERDVDEEVNKSSRDESVTECGMMGGMSSPMSAPKQPDSVTMSVNMNGSGTGGIRDLLNALKDIQDGPDDSMPGDDMDMGPDSDPGPDTLLKKKIDSMAGMIDDDFANAAPGDEGPKMGGVDMMTKSGDDLHKEKDAYPKAAGGDNAMRLKDGATFKLPSGDVKIKLENLYNQIKNR